MSGREFLAVWALALAVTAAVAGWIFLMTDVVFTHSTVLAGVFGLVPVVLALMGATWLMNRE